MSTKINGFLICIMVFMPVKTVCSQNKPNPVIEGGKTLLELIRVFKTPRQTVASQNTNAVTSAVSDSCVFKQTSDLCFKNSSTKILAVSIYKRTDTGYDARPFVLKILIAKEECLYEMRAGIYKYRIEIDGLQGKTILREGELKLQACENMQREITE